MDEQLAAWARAEGLKLTGEGGLLGRLTKVVAGSGPVEIEVPEQAISAMTDRAMDGMAAWQNRPLDPVIFINCVNAGDPRRQRGEPADLRRTGSDLRRHPRHPGIMGRGAR